MLKHIYNYMMCVYIYVHICICLLLYIHMSVYALFARTWRVKAAEKVPRTCIRMYTYTTV